MPASMQRRRSSSKALPSGTRSRRTQARARLGRIEPPDDTRRLQPIEDRHVHVHEHQIEGRPACQALAHGIHRPRPLPHRRTAAGLSSIRRASSALISLSWTSSTARPALTAQRAALGATGSASPAACRADMRQHGLRGLADERARTPPRGIREVILAAVSSNNDPAPASPFAAPARAYPEARAGSQPP